MEGERERAGEISLASRLHVGAVTSSYRDWDNTRDRDIPSRDRDIPSRDRDLGSMMVEIQRDAPLFERIMMVQVHQEGREAKGVTTSAPTSASATRPLCVRVFMGTRTCNAVTSRGTQQRERVLHVEVTDERDMLFLYSMDVGAEDFHTLKQDQALLVEFNDFSDKFIELLEHCLIQKDSASAIAPTVFVARLVSSHGIGVFSIVELNRFKELTHLSLKLREGTDVSLKAYLGSRLTQSLAMCARLTAQLESHALQLQSERELRHEISNELENMRKENERHELQARSVQASELNAKQQEFITSMEAMRQQHEAAMECLRVSTSNEIQRLRDQVSKLGESKAQLTEETLTLRAQIKDVEQQLHTTTDQKDSLRRQNQNFEVQNRELSDKVVEYERSMQRLQLQCEALEQKLLHNQQAVEGALKLQKAAEDAASKAHDDLVMYKDGVQSLQDKLHTSVQEIHKGNKVIRRLQEEIKIIKAKLITKNKVIHTQESVIDEERRKCVKLESNIAQLEKSVQDLQRDLAGAKDEVTSLQHKLQESQGVITSNQQVITWLNKEINDMQLGRSIPAGGSRHLLASTAKTLPYSAVDQTPHPHSPPSVLGDFSPHHILFRTPHEPYDQKPTYMHTFGDTDGAVKGGFGERLLSEGLLEHVTSTGEY